jgi:hypothetical protein
LEFDNELAELVGSLVTMGQGLLRLQGGEFLPFAATVGPDGTTAMLRADIGKEQPGAKELIEFFEAALTAMAKRGTIRGSGICVNVSARLPGYLDVVDAMCCYIERKDEQPIQFFWFHFERHPSGDLERFPSRWRVHTPPPLPVCRERAGVRVISDTESNCHLKSPSP